MAIRTISIDLVIGAGTTPPTGDLAGYTTSSSASVDGTSMTFTDDVQHNIYDNGSISNIWVRPIFPATSVVIDSYTPGWGAMLSGRNGNGAEKNPRARTPDAGVFGSQGFDEFVDTDNGVPYLASDRAAVPITLVPGDCLVIAQSKDTPSDDSGLKRLVYVHCVTDIPYADEFAPPYVWPTPLTSRPRHRYSDVNEALYPSLSTAGFSNARPDGTAGIGTDITRRLFDPVVIWKKYNLRTQDGAATYGRERANALDNLYALICSDAAVADKRASAKILIQRGIDTYGVALSAAQRGIPWIVSDGGHLGGHIPTLMVAGHLLGDTTMRDYVKTNFTPMGAGTSHPGEYGQRDYLTPTIVTATQEVGWQGSGSGADFPYEDAHAEAPAVPEWTGQPATGGGLSTFQINNVWDTSTGASQFYRNSEVVHVAHGQVACLLAMGLRTTYDHEAYFDYQARHFAMQYYGDDPWRYVGGSPTARYAKMSGSPPAPVSITKFSHEFYDTHVFQGTDLYTFPTGVNDFNGAT